MTSETRMTRQTRMTRSTSDRPDHAADARRGFLAKMLAIACGGIATLTPLAAGLWAFLDPLGRRSAAARFVPVADLAAIPADGVPRRFPVVTDRKDAWTGYAAEPVGGVWLRRQAGSDVVEALSATCPHAGCSVEMAAGGTCFRCPCHNSEFTFGGGIMEPSPSPRPMDALDCQVSKDGAVAVQWQVFLAGIADKVAKR
jgi:menaquinol-cytochrome c reductase iron-sulfur subunit